MLKTRTMAVIAAVTMATAVPFQASGQSQGGNSSSAEYQAGSSVVNRVVGQLRSWARSPYESLPMPNYEFKTSIGGAAGSYVSTRRQVKGWKATAGACRNGGTQIASALDGNIIVQDHAQAYDGRRGWSDMNGFYDHDREFKKPVSIRNTIDIKIENQTLVFSMRRNSMSIQVQNLEDRFENEIERTLARRFNDKRDLRINLSASEAAYYRSRPDEFMRGLTNLTPCTR